ncbi:uncharacterized protein PGTG_21560 [Puccinia graminis f. sp. tritici CRL 75-36-700-3]|uniref:Uncharacterized protein n=1 Tax=Puccinia graminis f. sp. tritici (strain CRL 75-36-700-3 / race SCCL) TaxID=418459 RepID=H6QRZ2_PUCGT|nr:uncharacterized protein PGTG_21560 [Puccinia graminis f. sp. tritici CRL 75-36-700-3]EHS63427.1 hypothetical protein PGTG_21560 [Puccinia graminis f. sp. tritici CRL 75-36-700-3]
MGCMGCIELSGDTAPGKGFGPFLCRTDTASNCLHDCSTHDTVVMNQGYPPDNPPPGQGSQHPQPHHDPDSFRPLYNRVIGPHPSLAADWSQSTGIHPSEQPAARTIQVANSLTYGQTVRIHPAGAPAVVNHPNYPQADHYTNHNPVHPAPGTVGSVQVVLLSDAYKGRPSLAHHTTTTQDYPAGSVTRLVSLGPALQGQPVIHPPATQLPPAVIPTPTPTGSSVVTTPVVNGGIRTCKPKRTAEEMRLADLVAAEKRARRFQNQADKAAEARQKQATNAANRMLKAQKAASATPRATWSEEQTIELLNYVRMVKDDHSQVTGGFIPFGKYFVAYTGHEEAFPLLDSVLPATRLAKYRAVMDKWKSKMSSTGVDKRTPTPMVHANLHARRRLACRPTRQRSLATHAWVLWDGGTPKRICLWRAGLHTGLHSVDWRASPHANLLWRAGAHANPHLACGLACAMGAGVCLSMPVVDRSGAGGLSSALDAGNLSQEIWDLILDMHGDNPAATAEGLTGSSADYETLLQEEVNSGASSGPGSSDIEAPDSLPATPATRNKRQTKYQRLCAGLTPAELALDPDSSSDCDLPDELPLGAPGTTRTGVNVTPIPGVPPLTPVLGTPASIPTGPPMGSKRKARALSSKQPVSRPPAEVPTIPRRRGRTEEKTKEGDTTGTGMLVMMHKAQESSASWAAEERRDAQVERARQDVIRAEERADRQRIEDRQAAERAAEIKRQDDI